MSFTPKTNRDVNNKQDYINDLTDFLVTSVLHESRFLATFGSFQVYEMLPDFSNEKTNTQTSANKQKCGH